MVNIEKIKENIKCPQFGDLEYGEWGALRLEQRIAYKELIEEIERLQDMDKILRNENINLKLRINKARELLNQEWYSVLRKETITKVKEILDKENK